MGDNGRLKLIAEYRGTTAVFFSSLKPLLFKERLVHMRTEKTVETKMIRSSDESLLGNLWILNIGSE